MRLDEVPRSEKIEDRRGAGGLSMGRTGGIGHWNNRSPDYSRGKNNFANCPLGRSLLSWFDRY